MVAVRVSGASAPPPAPPVTVYEAIQLTVTPSRKVSDGCDADDRVHTWVQARRSSAVGDHSIPGAHVVVVPSPNVQRALAGSAVTRTVMPPTVAVPVSAPQLGIQNQLARLTIWSPEGLNATSGTGMVMRLSTPAATAAGSTASGGPAR